VKIKNASYFRAVAGAELRARVHVKHPFDNGSTIGRNLRLGTSPQDVFLLRPREHVLVSIDPGTLSEESVTRLRVWGYDAAAEPSRTLEELLGLPNAYFSVQIRSTDGWTGTEHYQETPRLRLASDPITTAGFEVTKTRLDQWYGEAHRRRAESSTHLARLRMLHARHPELRPHDDHDSFA
jgi:hypothetical protein